MFSPISISLSPNVTHKDILIILSYIFFPWKWFFLRKGKSETKLIKNLNTYFQSEGFLSFDSGRSALYAILKNLDLNEGDEVLLPAYTCIVVPNPVVWNKLKPVYVDIEEETFNIDPNDARKKITARSKVLIIQHTFGKPANLKELLGIAKKHNLKVIEDCAHALGTEYQNQKTGTFGDAAIFSFGRDKCISCVHGGAALINDKKLFSKIKSYHAGLPYPSLRVTLRHLRQPIIFALAIPVYNFFNLGKVIIVLSQKTHFISKVFVPGEKQGKKPHLQETKLANSLSEIAIHQLELINTFNEHRQKISKFYDEHLKNTPGIKLPLRSPDEKYTFLRYTVQTDHAEKIMKAAKLKGILLGDWYTTPIAPKDASKEAVYYKTGSCPVTEKIAKKTLNLPTHQNISEKKAEKISHFIKKLIMKT